MIINSCIARGLSGWLYRDMAHKGSSEGESFHLVQSEIAQYIVAALFVGLVLSGCWKYTEAIGEAKGLAILNRSVSSSTVFLLSFVLLLGPMSRLFGGLWKTLFMLRKEIGICTFFIGLTHVYLSMFPLARRGPWGFYTGRPWSAYPGLIGLVSMAALFAFSFVKLQRLLSATLWWKMQYLGARIALIGIVVHAVVLRWPSWTTWVSNWRQGADSYPPLALLAVLFALYVTGVKVLERTNPARAKMQVTALTFGFVLLTAFLFIFPFLA